MKFVLCVATGDVLCCRKKCTANYITCNIRSVQPADITANEGLCRESVDLELSHGLLRFLYGKAARPPILLQASPSNTEGSGALAYHYLCSRQEVGMTNQIH